MPIFSFGQKQDRVERMLRKMSVRDKVGQLFIVTYGQHTPDAQIEEAIKKDRVGGLIIMEDEMEHYANRMNNYQKQSRIPLVISIDGEWGASMRFDTLTQFPRNMQLGALSNTDMIYKVGRAMADQFRRVGVHINYAPTVDVNNNPNNPVIGQRSFGDNPQKVAKYGAALIRGMQDGGVWTSAKHFPGHGDTDVDSHKALPTLPFDRARLDAMELYPFQEAINQDVWMVMVGHLNVPALDPTGMPSSLSYPIITKLLKEEMGFKGIVITDALGMKGVSTYMPAELVPLASFKAGSDVLLMPAQSWHRSIKNVIKAVKKGEISRERLDESVRKVLKMKEQLGLLDGTPFIDPKNIYEDTETKEEITVSDNARTREADFALRISGNSMEPRYHDGDILLVQECETVEFGELGIFILDGNGFFKVFGGDRLYSLNPEYGDILLKDFDDVRVAGKVIGKLKKR